MSAMQDIRLESNEQESWKGARLMREAVVVPEVSSAYLPNRARMSRAAESLRDFLIAIH